MSFYFLFITLFIFSLGDFLAIVTKAKLSSIFTALILFLVCFMTGVIPADIIKQAGLEQMANWASAFLVFHMGTMVNIRELVREWRTVLLSIVAMIVTILAILATIPIVGKEAAIVSIPVMKGGIIATKIVTDTALDKGMQVAAALAALVYAIHKFVGTPFASYCGIKEARKIVEDFRAGNLVINDENSNSASGKQPFYVRKGLDKFFTDNMCLGLTAFFSWIAVLLQGATGLHHTIWCLFIGATISYYELIPSKILDRAKTSGFMNMVVFAAIIPSMAKITMSDLIVMSWQMVVLFGATLISTYLFFYVLPFWKIVGSRNLAVGITMANMIGFPATWLVVNEVATAVAKTPEEKDAIMKVLMPSYVIAGFATVTTLSIVVAGIFIKFL